MVSARTCSSSGERAFATASASSRLMTIGGEGGGGAPAIESTGVEPDAPAAIHSSITRSSSLRERLVARRHRAFVTARQQQPRVQRARRRIAGDHHRPVLATELNVAERIEPQACALQARAMTARAVLLEDRRHALGIERTWK